LPSESGLMMPQNRYVLETRILQKQLPPHTFIIVAHRNCSPACEPHAIGN
jgi:hypothetical protein